MAGAFAVARDPQVASVGLRLQRPRQCGKCGTCRFSNPSKRSRRPRWRHPVDLRSRQQMRCRRNTVRSAWARGSSRGTSPSTSARLASRSFAARLERARRAVHLSRLLIDPNRGADDPTLVMRLSDGALIPGNARIDAAEIDRRRRETYWRPYRDAVARTLDAMLATGVVPAVVPSIPSRWFGRVSARPLARQPAVGRRRSPCATADRYVGR